jgi:hypothetical protein
MKELTLPLALWSLDSPVSHTGPHARWVTWPSLPKIDLYELEPHEPLESILIASSPPRDTISLALALLVRGKASVDAA